MGRIARLRLQETAHQGLPGVPADLTRRLLLKQSSVAIARLSSPLRISSSAYTVPLLTGLWLGGKCVGEKVLLGATSIHFQGIIENHLKVGGWGGRRESRGTAALPHERANDDR